MPFLEKNDFLRILRKNLEKNRKNSRVVILADSDVEGIVSSALLDAAIYRAYNIEPESLFRNQVSWKIPVKDLHELRPDVLILVDIALSSPTEYRNVLRLSRHVLQVDHHVTPTTGFPSKIFSFNPSRNGVPNLPSTYLIHELTKDIAPDIAKSQAGLQSLCLGLVDNGAISFVFSRDTQPLLLIESSLKRLFIKFKENLPAYWKTNSNEADKAPFILNASRCVSQWLIDEELEEVLVHIVNAFNNKTSIDYLLNRAVDQYGSEMSHALHVIDRMLHSDVRSLSDDPSLLVLRNSSIHSNELVAKRAIEILSKAAVVYRDEEESSSPVEAHLRVESQIDLVPYFRKYGGFGHSRSCKAHLSEPVRKQLIRNLLHEFKTARKN